MASGYYVGESHDGQPDGWGIWYLSEEVIEYQGQLRAGQLHGWGRGAQYAGDWRDGKRRGQGRLMIGEPVYAGTFNDGTPHGSGRLADARGRVFAGAWTEGCSRQGRRWAAIERSPRPCGFETPHTWKSDVTTSEE